MPRMARDSVRRQSRSTIHTDENGETRKIHLRRAHKKSHLGCKNCKQRRIKCDEKLPICSQCKRASGDCSYLYFTPEEVKEHESKRRQSATNDEHMPPILETRLSLSTRSASSETENNISPPTHLHSSQPLSKDNPHTNSLITAPGDIGHSIEIPSPLSDSQQQTQNSNVNQTGVNLPSINRQAPAKQSPISLPTFSENITISPLSDKQTRIPELERRNLVSTVAIARHGFETDDIRDAYANWMDNTLALAYHHNCLFHAVMAFSCDFSFIQSQQDDLRVSSNKHRYLALQEIQQELLKITPSNTDALLSTSLILSWDVFLQEDNIASYITLSRGLGAVLEKVQVVCSTTQMALCMTESLFQSVKTILHPPYDETFFHEVLQKTVSLSSFIEEAQDKTLLSQYEFLVNFAQRVLEFLQSSARDSEVNFLRDPCVLFGLLREWLAKFPCYALSLDVLTDDHAMVLYAYYHALTRALDALLPEARYLFQFSFVGPIDLVGPENCLMYMSDPKVLALLEYPTRVISFFKKRQSVLNEIFISMDPLAQGADGVPLYRMPSPEPVRETFVTSFSEKFEFQPYMPYATSNTLLQGRSSSSSCSSVSASSTTATSPLSQISEDHSSWSSASSPQNQAEKTVLPKVILRSRESGTKLNSNSTSVSSQQPLPPGPPALSSLSMGFFKSYFDDRMDILQRFVIAQ